MISGGIRAKLSTIVCVNRLSISQPVRQVVVSLALFLTLKVPRSSACMRRWLLPP